MLESLDNLSKEIIKENEEEKRRRYLDTLESSVEINFDIRPSQEFDSPIVMLFSNLITSALNQNVSFIVMEIFRGFYRFRYKINGKLITELQPSVKLHDVLTNQFLIKFNLDVSKKNISQFSTIRVKYKDSLFKLKLNTIMTNFGLNLVIEIINKEFLEQKLNDNNLSKKQLNTVKENLGNPSGMILVTGLEERSKRKFLYSLLNEFEYSSDQKNIYYINESDIYERRGLSTCTINKNFSYLDILNNISLSSPDMIFIEKINDNELLNRIISYNSIKSSVLGTYEAKDIIYTLNSLINDRDLDIFKLAESLTLIIQVTQLRILCKECRVKAKLTQRISERLGITMEEFSSKPIYTAKGCKQCNGTGFTEVKDFYNILEIDSVMRDFIKQKPTFIQIKEFLQNKQLENHRKTILDQLFSGSIDLNDAIKNL